MPPLSHTLRRGPNALWQSVPWNSVFWFITLTLCALATYLTTQVELQRSQVHSVDASADIQNGDMVDVLVILNGDEIIIGKAGARAKVRMLGIRSFDAVVNEWEITAHGRASVAYLEHWVLGHEVKLVLDSTPRDVHGRYLAYVERDGNDVNRAMVEEGIAMVYTEYPCSREAVYLSSEQIARNARRGIWTGNKATRRIRGLRHDWDVARRRRTGQPFADPLRE